MTEQKKVKVVVLPCGKLCERILCGDCVFYEFDRDRKEGYCSKYGGWHKPDYYCDGAREA